MQMEIYRWMKNLAFFHVLTTAILHILPDKRYEQYIRLFMGLLLILLICTPVFSIFGKGEEFLEGFQMNYGKKEQERLKTEAGEIQENFLKEACGEETEKRIREILKEQKIFSAEVDVTMEKELQVMIKISGEITERQREAVKNELEKTCGFREEQYQILDSGNGMEGVGNSAAGGNSSFVSGGSGIPEEK